MGRHLAAAAVVAADSLLFFGLHRDLRAVAAYAVVVAVLVWVRHRAVFPAGLGLSVLSGGSYVLLLWISYRAGLTTVTRRDTAVVLGAVAGWACAALTMEPLPQTVAVCVVFVVLPLLVGRYLAQHRRLVSTLESHNRQLRRERELLAEREQLRERLRIARDMHDSLGHRLSLVSVQAAALEVSDLPSPHREAVRSLASATRAAAAEVYELIGSLRGTAASPGLAGTDALVGSYQAAGIPVTVETHGTPATLTAATDTAAYRVIEEGLTNAAKHAPGQPVSVHLTWEPDSLLLTVTNPVAGPDVGTRGAGFGLVGLRERVEPVGGFLDHRETGGTFRLVAMLPLAPDPAGPEPPIGRVRATALGVATGALLFVMLPASLMTGVG